MGEILEPDMIINWKDLFTQIEMETAVIESKKPIVDKDAQKPKGAESKIKTGQKQPAKPKVI